jgi:AraC family transcriptional regulator
MNNIKKIKPDFSVRWSDRSLEFESNIYFDDVALTSDTLLKEKMREPLVLLETDSTCVAVSELSWTEPTTISLIPDRPSFCMTLSTSPTTSIQYGFDDEFNFSGGTGSTAFLVPGKKITSHHSTGSVRAIMCSFKTDYAENIVGTLDQLSAEQLSRALNIQNSLITTVLFRLMKEAMHPGPMSEAVVETCGTTLLVECAHWLQNEPLESDYRGKLTSRHVAIIDRYLAEENGKLPSVAELAKICGFSERYFLKLFRAHKKCTVTQYMKSVQITKAKSYLIDTDLPLKEIAYRLGFSSPANFSSAFRSSTGKTPGQIRKER